MQPYLVDASSVRVPDGFTPVAIAGRAIGLLGFVQYVEPSPLVYSELVWMPCLVSASGARGYYVDAIYVDSEPSLEAGRELWAFPKQMARFEVGAREVAVETDDGVSLELELLQRGPSVRVPAGTANLQDGGDSVVRFRSSGSTRLGSGGIAVRAARGVDGWSGWSTARRMRGLGAAMTDFELTMHPPRRLPRRA